MSAANPIRFNVAVALAVILLVVIVISANRNSALRIEKDGLSVTAADLRKQVDAAIEAQDTLRADATRFEARLTEATNTTAATFTASGEAQNSLHEKLRAELARLSADGVLKDAQIESLRVQLQELRTLQNKTETTYRNSLATLTATSNEVTRIRASDADKAGRLLQREKELAAKATELAAANNTARLATAAQGTAEQNAKVLQAQLDAGKTQLDASQAKVNDIQAKLTDAQAKLNAAQTEITALKAKLAELTPAQPKPAAPTPAP